MLTKSTDGYVSRLINRKFSTRITRFIVKHNIGLTPNQVSFISFTIGILAGILILLKHFVIGGILVQVSSIIDGVDGELARAKNMSSPKGAFIDSMLDRLVDIFIIASIIIIVLQLNNTSTLELIYSIAAITGSIMVSYLHASCERSLRTHPVKITRVPLIASRDVRLFIIFILTIIGQLELELIILSIITYSYVLAQLIAVSRVNIEKK